jgi:general secretion pathway protein D
LMFLDDGNLPLLPTWEEQIQQLPEVPEETPAAAAGEE